MLMIFVCALWLDRWINVSSIVQMSIWNTGDAEIVSLFVHVRRDDGQGDDPAGGRVPRAVHSRPVWDSALQEEPYDFILFLNIYIFFRLNIKHFLFSSLFIPTLFIPKGFLCQHYFPLWGTNRKNGFYFWPLRNTPVDGTSVFLFEKHWYT